MALTLPYAFGLSVLHQSFLVTCDLLQMKAKLHYDQLAGQINEMLRHDADYAEAAQPEVDTQHSRNHQGTFGSDVPNLFLSPTKHQQRIEKPSSNKPCQDQDPAAPRYCYSPATALLQPGSRRL